MEETVLSINPNPEIAIPRRRACSAGRIWSGYPGHQSATPASHSHATAAALGQRSPAEGVARWGRQRPRISPPLPLFETSLPLTFFLPTATLSGSAASRLRGVAPALSPPPLTHTFPSPRERFRAEPSGRGAAAGCEAAPSRAGLAPAAAHAPAGTGRRGAASGLPRASDAGGAPPGGGTPGPGCAAGQERRA